MDRHQHQLYIHDVVRRAEDKLAAKLAGPDSTPAALLRAAATKLREAATAALPADPRLARPWHVEDCADEGEESNDCPCIVAFTQHDDGAGFGVATHYVADAETTGYASWIALMHPGVGTALADWLDAAAEEASWIGVPPAALATARVILNHGGAK